VISVLNGKPLTVAKYNQHYAILSAIKRCFSRSPVHREALNDAKCKTSKGPRGGARYICEECNESFGAKETNVDHKEPVIPVGILSRDMSWDDIIERIFCDRTNLQVLCKGCHSIKSKEENAARKKAKNG
jgi:hypothetical protein